MSECESIDALLNMDMTETHYLKIIKYKAHHYLQAVEEDDKIEKQINKLHCRVSILNEMSSEPIKYKCSSYGTNIK
jgi:hypothetical protein